MTHPRSLCIATRAEQLEAKVLDTANNILAAKGGEGQTIANLIQRFIAARGSP